MRSRQATAILTVLALALGWAGQARAEQGVTPPSQAQVDAARSMFKRGLVLLVEPDAAGKLKQVTLFGDIAAPQKAIYDVISDPSTLPQREPSTREVAIKAKQGNALTYAWTYGDALTHIEGTTALALAPPQAVFSRSITGFGPGFSLFRLWPAGADHTTLSLSMCIDPTKTSNPILRWLSNANPNFQQVWNVGYSVMVFRGIEQVAVKRAGGTVPAPSGISGDGPLRPLGPDQVAALRPLLQKGPVAVIESDAQGRVAQASVAELVAAPPAKVQQILEDPGSWGTHFKSLDISDVAQAAGGSTFKMALGFTAFTISSDLALQTRPDGVDVTSPAGQLSRSLLTFRQAPDGAGTILTSTGRLRLHQGGRILRGMIEADPYFGHALNAAGVALFSRSFRLGAEGRH
jgi:hypothetical protein